MNATHVAKLTKFGGNEFFQHFGVSFVRATPLELTNGFHPAIKKVYRLIYLTDLSACVILMDVPLEVEWFLSNNNQLRKIFKRAGLDYN